MKIHPNKKQKYRVICSIFPAFTTIIIDNISEQRALDIVNKNNETCDIWENYYMEIDENKTKST